MSQPRTHPFATLLALSTLYAIAALILAIFEPGRTVGMEYAFALSIVAALLSPAAAVLAGGHLITHDSRVFAESIAAVLIPTLVAPLVTAVVFLLLPTCNARASVLIYALGPPATALLCLALVALLGKVLPYRGIVVGLAYILVLGSGALTLWRLYREPPTFFLNHFFGAYYGMIYDEVAGIDQRLVQFRALSWLWALGGLALARSMMRVRGRVVRRAPAWAVLFLSAAGLLSWTWQQQLHPDRASIEQRLSKHATTPHFDIYVDARTPDRDLQRIALDHEFRRAQIKQQLGVLPQGRVRSYIYPEPVKAQMIGAAGTQLARPWQQEIHLNASPWPHPVLAHELVHVYAADMGSGPLRTSSRLGVFIRPALIEGLAVAIAPDLDELPLVQKARALRAQDRLPPVNDLMSLTGFGLESPARAYVAAGALIKLLIQNQGIGRVRELYRTGDFEVLAGASAKSVEKSFWAWLDQKPASKLALALTRRRFARGSFFDRRCVHARQERLNLAHQAIEQGHNAKAVALLESLHEDNPEDLAPAQLLQGIAQAQDNAALLDRSMIWLTQGGELTPIEQAELDLQRHARQWRLGDLASVCKNVDAVDLEVLPSYLRRRYLVWQQVCPWIPSEQQEVQRAARAVIAFLASREAPGHGHRSDLLALQQARAPLAHSPHPAAAALDGLLAYLIARQIVLADPSRAQGLLTHYLDQPIWDQELRVAATQQRATASYLADDFAGALQDCDTVITSEMQPYIRRAQDLRARIVFEQKQDIAIQIETVATE